MENPKPLLNKKIVITRPKNDVEAFAKEIEDYGGTALTFPLLEIKHRTLDEEIKSVIKNISSFDWLIFTSINGIHAFFNHLSKESMSLLHKKKFAVTGKKTAIILAEYGYTPSIIPKKYTAEHLAEQIIAEVDKDCSMLLLSGNLSKPLLKEKLRHCYSHFKELVVYETIKKTEVSKQLNTFLQEHEIDFLTFTSGSAATTYLSLMKEINGNISNYKIACIGPITAQEFLNEDITPTVVAEEYTIQGLLQELVNYYEEVEK
jgi:uroporphyrinogen-III synthase